MLRYLRRGSRRIIRFGWKGAIAWYGILAIGGFFLLNGVYQVIRKPGELFAPVSASMSKSPESTWQSYGSLFEEHSTSIISPEFLAALAQVESDGNPIARTYWRWQWSWNLVEIYRPASSALGMFQFTDGTFAAARRYCIHDHEVVSEGPWYDVHSCWFNGLYTRTIPSHSIEMTAAYLHQSVIGALAVRPSARITVAQKQKLAAVIHLCGAARGQAFVKRNFRLSAGERCGTHSLGDYLSQIDKMKKRFSRFLRGTNSSQLGPVLPVISGSPS
jgi:hypothetical protein